MQYNEFRDSVKKVALNRIHKITHSIGTRDIYKLLRKNKWEGIEKPITEKMFYDIIREMNNLLANDLVNGREVILPCKLGTLEIRKSIPRVEFVNGELKTTLPVDWNATLKLWYEDKESYNNKTLVRCEPSEVFSIYYNKTKANYNNKSFYLFRPIRSIKQQISLLVKNNLLDAYLVNKYD